MRHQTKLSLLASITIIVVIVAALFSKSQAPQTTVKKTTLFPALADKVNDVARITINSSNSPVILQKMANGQWVVSSADNYPAQFNKIKSVVVGLSQMQILETKTDNPRLYPSLGVEGHEKGNTSSLLLTLEGQSNATLASLIIGKPRKKNVGGDRPRLYVRKENAKNALLVESYLQIKPTNNYWYERNVIHIPATRIKTVNIMKSSGDNLTLNKSSKGSADLEVTKGQTSSPSVLLNKVATFFEDMSVEGVHTASHFVFPDDTTITTFTTFDGLMITVKNALIDGKAFVHFAFTTASSEMPEGDAETVSIEEESQKWSKSLSPWIYEIPAFKYETLDVNVAQN